MMSNSSDSSYPFGQEVKVRCLMSDRYQQRAFDMNIMPASVQSFSMWDGFVVVEDTGRAWWSSNTNPALQAVLSRSSRTTAKPERVALGPNDYYFLKLDDGSVFFEGPPLFKESIRCHLAEKTVEIVAFGRQSWFVKYTDGTYEWSEDLPKGLEDILQEDEADVTFLSMGPRDQWFVKFDDGTCKAVVHYEGALRELNEVINEGGDIDLVALGCSESYCILYTLHQSDDLQNNDSESELESQSIRNQVQQQKYEEL
eukprot:TRINITY_DN4742_c0_g3_i1.p3 TRINITY_DN4742_c0_g3~~TRINITY_DN4742_c0_g3_i1.p3  ORF type:complete len:291 (-),score=23.65 TRINITY_DN4742_c0_g3_i1:3843-4610(-)